MLLANVIVVAVMVGASIVLTLDSGPTRTALHAFARWQHRRRVGHDHGAAR